MITSSTGTSPPDPVSQPDQLDPAPLQRILELFKDRKGAIIPILQHVQDAYGYLPKSLLPIIAKKTRVPLSQIYGVATFYAQFHLTRRGRHLLRICDGTACHVRGSDKNIAAVEKSINLHAGETSPDYKYTLEIVYCLGSCGLSPVAVIDDKVCGRLTPDTLLRRLDSLK